MVEAFTRLRLQEEGMEESIICQVLDATPLATHNQRGKARLLIGTQRTLEIRELIDIVEKAMSSENYGLLKRPDELYIVNKAHARPQFAEDVARDVLGGMLSRYSDLPDDTFVQIEQKNEETIHKYDVHACAWGTFGELRQELQHGYNEIPRTSLETWLGYIQ
jgi:MptA/FolE2 family GTP cyclohydrolase